MDAFGGRFTREMWPLRPWFASPIAVVVDSLTGFTKLRPKHDVELWWVPSAARDHVSALRGRSRLEKMGTRLPIHPSIASDDCYVTVVWQ